MNKSELLVLIASCKNSISNILKRSDISQEQKNALEALLAKVNEQESYIKTINESNQKELDHFSELYTRLAYSLKNFNPSTSLVVAGKKDIVKKPEAPKPVAPKVKVKKVIKEEEQKQETKDKRKKLIKWLHVIGLALLIAILIHSCHENKKNNNNNAPVDPSYTTEQQQVIYFDINDPDSLMNYAMYLQSQLPEGSDYTLEDIIYALRLANFEDLSNSDVFRDRDEIYTSTKNIGELSNLIGVDQLVTQDSNTDIYVSEAELKDIIMCVTDNNLTIDAFSNCMTEKGYDIYNLCQICTNQINGELRENTVYYAKVFSEIIARKLVTFSLTEDSPVSTYYTLIGMYNANFKKINELTSGHGWGPIYGDGTRIDGTYGCICVEELTNYLTIGNQSNIFFTDIIDQNLTYEAPSRY